MPRQGRGPPEAAEEGRELAPWGGGAESTTQVTPEPTRQLCLACVADRWGPAAVGSQGSNLSESSSQAPVLLKLGPWR